MEGPILVAILIVVLFVTYILNQRTPVPEGINIEVDKEKCKGCTSTTCRVKQ